MTQLIPDVIFKTRVRDETTKGKILIDGKIFLQMIILKKKVILFSSWCIYMTCSTVQLPEFENYASVGLRNWY